MPQLFRKKVNTYISPIDEFQRSPDHIPSDSIKVPPGWSQKDVDESYVCCNEDAPQHVWLISSEYFKANYTLA